MAGHSRPKDGVASLAYNLAIHDDVQRVSDVKLCLLHRFMDPRVKPGGDAVRGASYAS
jgi:hypothetical protein